MKVYVLTHEYQFDNGVYSLEVYVYDSLEKAQKELKRIYTDSLDEREQENYTLSENCLVYEYNDFDKVIYKIVEREVL